MSAEQRQFAIPDWILLGDYSRRIFLQWLTESSQVLELKDLPLWVRYAETFSIRCGDGAWLIGTPRTIPGTVLLVPLADSDLDEYRLLKNTRFALFEEFPYGKQSSDMTLQHLRQEYESNSVLVVLMDIPRRQGSTDIDCPGNDLKASYEKYSMDENVCVCTAVDKDDVLQILHWRESSEHMWRRRLEADLNQFLEAVEDSGYDYEMLYMDFFESILSEQTIDKICSFQSVERSRQNSIWNGYTRAAMLQMFPPSASDGLYPVADLYRDTIKEKFPNLNLWDLEKDYLGFVDTMKKALEKALRDPKLSAITFKSNTEEAYLRAVNKHKLNVHFRRRLDYFVKTNVPHILGERLKLRYTQIKETL